ncbi:MAG: DUF3696 domain-containing protein [Chloroflexi bacterium]|nr:DUF3696 domain-containing protein [Chloroflexota bacterium]
MITRLRIQNFKSLADTGDMAIRPLTFLVGPNSAGKSSVLQALLMLRQTVDERDPSITLKFNGPWVNLGSYLDCIHRVVGEEAGQRELGIGFTFRENFGGGDSGGWLIDFICQFGFDGEVRLQRAGYRENNKELAIERTEANQYYTVSNVAVQPRKFYDLVPLPSAVAGNVNSVIEVSRQREDYVFALESLFARLFYLGPLRQRPESFYRASSESPRDVGLAGERALDVLIAEAKHNRDDLLAGVRHWFREFEIASGIEMVALTPTVYELRLTDWQIGVVVNYPGVGFGASQILPIIVEGFLAPAHSVLLIEQPEIHLHPRAQARLADLLSAISKEEKTLIVETHSEHLLSRIQVQIAEGNLARDNVAIYFFEPAPEGTRVIPIEINELGQFATFPPGFFDEGLRLADQHIQAVARTHRQANGRI